MVSWTKRRRDELARLWPEVRAGRLRAEDVAARLGGTVVAVREAVKRHGIARRRLTLGRARRRVLALYARGATRAAIARDLGVIPATVYRWCRTLGLPDRYDRSGPAAARLIQKGVRAAALRRGRDSLSELYRDRRRDAYSAVGYPPTVCTACQARAIDLARRHGGVTYHDRGWGGWTCLGRRRALKYLEGCGTLVNAGMVACRVRDRRPVTVYRLDFRAEGMMGTKHDAA